MKEHSRQYLSQSLSATAGPVVLVVRRLYHGRHDLSVRRILVTVVLQAVVAQTHAGSKHNMSYWFRFRFLFYMCSFLQREVSQNNRVLQRVPANHSTPGLLVCADINRNITVIRLYLNLCVEKQTRGINVHHLRRWN